MGDDDDGVGRTVAMLAHYDVGLCAAGVVASEHRGR
jgi:hypothetical protein